MIVSAACAAGLMAQGFPPPAATAAPGDANNDVAAVDQGGAVNPGGAPDQAQRPQFNDPPPPPNGVYAPAQNGGSYGPAPNGGYGPAPNGNYGPAPVNVPATLNMQSGAFVTVRVNQWLSSDRNQTGDTFYATLAQPLIVDGVVVARQGSTVMGRVSEAHKAGRVEGTSGLGLQLTSLSLVDGQQVSIQSQVVDRKGNTSVGRDAAAIGGTTAAGAAIGASAAGGTGAAIGAGAGVVASTIGVLLTRGRPTEVYPETMLTFRLDAPVAISTTHATAAFHYADQDDYGMGNGPQQRMAQMPPRPMGPPPVGVYATPYYSPYYSPYYYGGGLSVFVGPGFYGGYRGGFGRGFRR